MTRIVSEGVIRRLWTTDIEALRRHYLRLDLASRRDRFARAVSDLYLSDRADEAFSDCAGLFGWIVEGEVRGVAELWPCGAAEGDAAFTVEKPFRRRGIGTSLFRRLMLSARNQGLLTLHVRCLPQNRSMQALAAKYGARLVFDGDDMRGEVRTERPTPLSVFQEALEEGLTLPAALLDVQQRPRGRGTRASRLNAPT